MLVHPAYLFVGSETDLKQRARSFMKEVLCQKKGCLLCVDCQLIEKQAHHAVLWFAPENRYTIESFETIGHTLSFELGEEEHFFFVFERADLFNKQCANSLLKPLEEPPRGYHFILLTSRADGILPTIRSRCLTQYFAASPSAHHPLYSYFTEPDTARAAEFLKELETNRVPEKDIIELLDQIAAYYYSLVRTGDEDLREYAQKQAELIDQSRLSLPMPGSSKLFLKNLYLTLAL